MNQPTVPGRLARIRRMLQQTMFRVVLKDGTPRHAMLLLLAFAAATVVVAFPLVRHLGSGLPGNLGDPLLNAWILARGAQWLRQGGNLWDAPIFHPYDDTFAYSEHLLGIVVFVAPIYWLTGNPLLMYNAALLGSFVLAAGGMYLLAHALTGRRDVAIVIALAFAFSPYRLGSQITRLQMLMTGWLPLALWAAHVYARTRHRRYLAWFVIACVFLILSNMYMLLIGALPLGAVLAYEALRPAQRERLALARHLALAILCVGLLLLPVVLKYRSVQDAMGFTRELGETQRYSANLGSYWSIVQGSASFGNLPSDITADRALYPGAALLCLGALGLLALRRRAPDAGTAWLYGGMTIVAVALSFGPEITHWEGAALGKGPYAWIVEHVPGVNGLRAPARFGLVVVLGLSVLGALGLTRVARRLPADVARGLLIAAAGVVLMEGIIGRVAIAPYAPQGRPQDQPLYEWLKTQPPASLLELPASPAAAQSPYMAHIYQYETLWHPHELVNGTSGYTSPLFDLLEGPASPFHHPDLMPDAARMVQALGIRYVSVHQDDYADPTLAEHTIQALRESGVAAAEHRLGRTHVFQLHAPTDRAEMASPAHPRIAVAPGQVSASHNTQLAFRVVDAEVDSRWTTGRDAAEAWVKVRFDRPRDVRHVRLELGDARDRYPTYLLVMSLEEDGTRRPLYSGSVLTLLGAGLIDDPSRAPIAIPLPPNQSRELQLLYVGESEAGWSIGELRLFGPRA